MLLSNLELLATAPGGVARLRELILTLAVQGKLVQQDPTDEPASVLLQKIRAEKDRLIAEGKIKRDKPLAEIAEQEKPFELPVGWEWVRLGSVLSLEYGSALPEKERLLGSIPVYGSNGIVGFHTSALVSEPSLIVGRKGSVGAINISLVPFWPIDTSYFVTPPSGIELHFAFHLLRSLGLAKHDKATAIPGINRNDVYAEIVGLPPLAEQSRIVTRVEALMRLCDALEAKCQLEAAQHAQLVSTLLGTLTASTTPEELADNWQRVAQHFDLLLDRPEAIDALEQTLLQLAVRGLLVPQDPTDEPASVLLRNIRAEKDRLIAEGKIKRDKPRAEIAEEEKPFELPVGWEWASLGDVGIVGSSSRVHQSDWKSAGVPFYRAREIVKLSKDGRVQNDLFISEELFANLGKGGWVPEVNDIMITGVGTIGVPYVVKAEDRFYFKDASVLIFKNYGRLDSSYLFLFMQSPLWIDCIHEHSMGTTVDTLTIARANATPIPLPPLAEQSRIVTRVTALRRLCADLRQRLTERQSVQARLAEALVQEVA